MWYGLIGVASFSLSLPATRIAVRTFDPVVVTLERALIAAVLAAAMLWITRQPVPRRSVWWSLGIVALGVVLGSPLLFAWAMQRVPASHGAIVLGLLPLFTAGAAALRAGERPSVGFWAASMTGSATVVGFALLAGAGRLQAADLALLASVCCAAIGYAEGGKLARDLGGWQVISWSLVLAAPFLLPPTIWLIGRSGVAGAPEAWLALGYLGVVSQMLGFCCWYKGLALGGVARVSQLQLLQPFMTILASGLLLGEKITPITLGAAVVVVGAVALGRRARVETVLSGPLAQGRVTRS